VHVPHDRRDVDMPALLRAASIPGAGSLRAADVFSHR